MKSFRDPTDEWLKKTMGEESNSLVTMLSKLTDQQYQFCVEYVRCGSHKKAAQAVKMSAGQNPALLIHLPKIAACINILTARREAFLGRKSAAEIMDRLHNTPLVEADDFDFSAGVVKEREEMIYANGRALTGLPDDALMENITGKRDPSAALMQLPKVIMAGAQNFGPQWVLERLVTIAERAMQIEPVFDRKGRPIGEFQFNAGAAIKALDMLGKTMSMFTQKVEITHELANFKESELDDRIKGLLGAHPELASVVEVVMEADEAASGEAA